MGYLINRISGLLSETPVEPEGPVGDYSSNVAPPSRSAAPRAVTAERALGLPAVFRAIEISAGIVSDLTLRAEQNGRVLLKQPALVTQPDPWRSFADWAERFVVSMATDGNVFLRKIRADATSIASAEILDPFLTHVRWQNGRKSYTTFDHRLGKFIDLADADVTHVWGLQVPGRTRGLGPIEACRLSLSGALDVRDYATGWFQTSDVPSGVLSSDQNLDPQTVAMYRKVWADPSTFDDQPDADTINRRVGPSIRVLGKGLSYAPIMLKPADAQWIEAQGFGVVDSARMFGVPADYVLAAVEGKSMTYRNLEMIDTQFMRITLRPKYLRKIEGAVSPMLPLAQNARYDLSEYLRPDAETRAKIDKTYVDLGVYDGQHVRDREKIPGSAPPRPAPAPAAPAEIDDREDTPA